jgi:hypothetical protein
MKPRHGEGRQQLQADLTDLAIGRPDLVPAAGEGTDGTGGGGREGSPPAAGGGGDALGRSDSSRSTMGRMSSGRGGGGRMVSLS